MVYCRGVSGGREAMRPRSADRRTGGGIRRLLAGERVTIDGAFTTLTDAVVLPVPARTPPLMIGGEGPRLLAATLPHVDWWNVWFDRFGNRAEGFAKLNARIDEACEQSGRDPVDVRRSGISACPVRGAHKRSRTGAVCPVGLQCVAISDNIVRDGDLRQKGGA